MPEGRSERRRKEEGISNKKIGIRKKSEGKRLR